MRGMRKLRENLPNRVYHLISRVAHRAFFLNAEERARFVELLKRVAAFSGVELLAYCVMTNHVHILVFVPEPEDLLVLPPLPVGFLASFGYFFISASRSSAVSPVLPPRPFHSSFVPLTIFGTVFSTPGIFGICTPLTALLMAF